MLTRLNLFVLVASILASGCMGPAAVDEQDRWREDVAPGHLELLYDGLHQSTVHLMAAPSGLISVRHDGQERKYTVTRWSEGNAPVDIAEFQDYILGFAVVGDVLHAVQRSKAAAPFTFWRVELATGAMTSVLGVVVDPTIPVTLLHGAGAEAAGSRIHFFGGCCKHRAIVVYDTQALTFRLAPDPLPIPGGHIEGAMTTRSRGSILLSLPPCCGSQRVEEASGVYEYNVNAEQLARVATLPATRWQPFAVGDEVWLLAPGALARLTSTDPLIRYGQHIHFLPDGQHRKVWPEVGTTSEGALLFGHDGSIYRWTPPTAEEWTAPPRTVSMWDRV